MRRGFTLVETITLLAVITLVVCVTTPAVQHSQNRRELAVCKNNLRQIGLAMHNYNDTHIVFPPGWVTAGYGSHSGFRFGWQAMILPYIEQGQLYQQLDFLDPAADGNQRGVQTAVPVYRCVSDTTPELNPLRGDLATSNYSGNFGSDPLPRLLPGRLSDGWPGHLATPLFSDGILWANSSIRFRDITDGTSNTLMVGERSFRSRAGIWGGVGSNHYEDDAVTDGSHSNRPGHSLNGYSSAHQMGDSGGVNVLFCDGAVRFVSYQINSSPDPDEMGTWQKLSSRHDGHVIEEF